MTYFIQNRDRTKTIAARLLNIWFAAVFLLCMCQVPGFAQAGPPSPYPEVVPGLSYSQQRIGDIPWSIHVVKIDRSHKEFELRATKAKGIVLGLGTVSEQVHSIPPDNGIPVVAINGDYFVIKPGPYQGDPLGLNIIQGELVSAPTGASFWMDASGSPHIGNVTSRFRVMWNDDLATPMGFNEERKDDAIVLYTPTLGPSTMTVGGIEFILEAASRDHWLPLRVGENYTGRVVELRETGDTLLTPGTVVMSVGPKLLAQIPKVKPGSLIHFSLETTPNLLGIPTAVGGGPVLVKQGKALEFDASQARHPRTALCFNDRYVIFFVVDGRQPQLSAGMTHQELAGQMVQLGCTEAINLDGGGSSTEWLGGRVMNSPSDGQERRVANALVFIIKKDKNKTP
jgi:hypothetical protein